jgi:hypothetical protein
MPLVSSRESVREGRPSLLAIIETVAASGLSIWLAWKQYSIGHIVIASALAPFLLLRTPRSIRYTIKKLNKVEIQWRDQIRYNPLFLWHWLAPSTKIMCSITAFLKWPSNAISHIPINFYKNVFVLDLGVPPQIVPGSEEVSNERLSILSEMNIYTYAAKSFETAKLHLRYVNDPNLIEMLHPYTKQVIDPAITTRFWRTYHAILTILKLMLETPFIILLALMFRFAVKSTALIWLPLLWIIRQSQPGKQVLDRIFVQVNQPWYKVMLGYSVMVIVAIFFKVALIFGVWRFPPLDWLGPLGVFGTRLVAPFELPLWHITSAFNALLAWVFFFLAKHHLVAKNFSTEAWPEPWIKREYVAFQVVRTTLSLYTIACTFYIAAATAWQTEWPPIRLILFPRYS